MNDGWICLHRKLLDKPVWFLSTPAHKTILITMLLMTNHEEKEWEWKGKQFAVNPGQFVTSLESIRKECGKGVSIQQIRRALDRFQKLDFCTNKSTKMGRVITILNWRQYQQKEECNRQRNRQSTDKAPTPNNNVTMKQTNLSTLTGTRKVDQTLPPCPQNKIIEIYNDTLPELPRCKTLSESYRKMLRTRWREDGERQSLEWWQNFFETKIKASSFLMGKKTEFTADLTWIVRPKNFTKIINGNYEDKRNDRFS